MSISGKFAHSLIGDASVVPDGGSFLFESVSTLSKHDGHSSAVVVPDSHLLFSGEMTRSGDDLILSGEGRAHTIVDYFKSDTHPALVSREGASLSAAVIDALTGHTIYAQATSAPAASQAIGHVMKLSGSASVVRNGVAVELNMGDAVLKGDVVQTGSGSSMSITFVDGSVFGMGASARMVLNEMVYDPAGTSNSSLISLVQGTITFVAGQTAKNGDMRVDTPVATMGIRGTAVLVEIAADDGPTKFSVLVEPDGHTGSYNLYNKVTGQLLGTISQAGQVTFVSANNNQITANELPATPADQQIAKALVQQVFQLYFPNYTPDDAAPKSNKSGMGSSGNNLADIHQPGNAPTAPSTSIVSIEVRAGAFDPVTGKIAALDKVYINSPAFFNAAPAFAIQAFVVTADSFRISDHVHITDPDIGTAPFFDLPVPFVPNSAKFVSAESSIPLPNGFDPLILVHVSQQTGEVSFDRHDFNFLNEGETLVYKIEFESRSGPDTGHLVIPFIITGKNDAPVFEVGDVPVVSAHAETASQTGNPNAVTSDVILPFHDPDFSDVGAGYSIQVMDVATASGQSAGLPDHESLMSFLTFGAVSKNFDTATGQATGVFSAPDNVFDYLGAHDSVTLKYTVELTDARGATGSEDVFVTITGSNDVPVIAINDRAQEEIIHEQPGMTGAQTLDEACGGLIHFTDVDLTDTPTATVCDQSIYYTAADGEGILQLTQAQADAIKSAFSIVPTASGHDGTIAWSYSIPDYQLDFLAQDETVTLVSAVQIDDHNGGTTSTTVIVTVTGTNDSPTITASVPDHLTESTSTDPGISSASAALALHDVDGVATYDAVALVCDGWVDHQDGTFTQTVNLGTATLETSSNTLTFTLDNAAADSLASGDHQQVVFNIPVTDGLSTVSTSVAFTIDGANDAPVLSASVLEATDQGGGTVSFTGLSASDADDSGGLLNVAAQAEYGTVVPASGEGTLASVNAILQSGFAYTATTASSTGTDAIAVIVTDHEGAASDAFHFIFQQPGCTGGAVLSGTGGNDAIFATAGSDSLTGGAGHDTFVFASLAGQDVVTDFCHGEDTIQIHSAQIADFNALLALTSDTNGNAVITVGGDSITLQGVHTAALTASDFHIV